MRHLQGSRAGLGLALFSALAFSTSGALAKSLIDAGWSPAAAVTARISIAALVLAVPGLMSLRGRWHILRREGAMVAAYGVIAVAGAQLFYFNAIRTLPVGVALMLEYLGIVLVVAWMWIRHGQRPRRLTLGGSAAALAGLALVLGVIGHVRLDLVGVLWGLGAGVGLATYFVVGSHSSEDLPPMALASGGMAIGAAVLLALGGVGALPMHATFGTVSVAGHRVSWVLPIVGLSLVAAVIAYVAGIVAARVLGAKLASFAGLAEVIFAVLIAWLLLGQLPTAVQLIGGALIVAGIALVRIDEMRSPSVPSARPAPAEAEPALVGE
ncbi:MAG TPA: DMT family transporter [Streptosporangiaceae bacterium]|jgi:drug/metabolite transporter (DMT)-like permease